MLINNNTDNTDNNSAAKEKQAIWLKKLREVVGDSNMFDYYNLEDNIGKGQFGLVKLATHRKNG